MFEPEDLSEGLSQDNVSVTSNHVMSAQSVKVLKKKSSAPMVGGQNCKVKGTTVPGRSSASDQEAQSEGATVVEW